MLQQANAHIYFVCYYAHLIGGTAVGMQNNVRVGGYNILDVLVHILCNVWDDGGTILANEVQLRGEYTNVSFSIYNGMPLQSYYGDLRCT